MDRGNISKLTLQRLPTYLSYLKSLPAQGNDAVSAAAIAGALGLGEVQVRKDLAAVSSAGRPKVGYLVSELTPGSGALPGLRHAQPRGAGGAGESGAGADVLFRICRIRAGHCGGL